jgi:hypothetical protein
MLQLSTILPHHLPSISSFSASPPTSHPITSLSPPVLSSLFSFLFSLLLPPNPLRRTLNLLLTHPQVSTHSTHPPQPTPSSSDHFKEKSPVKPSPSPAVYAVLPPPPSQLSSFQTLSNFPVTLLAMLNPRGV